MRKSAIATTGLLIFSAVALLFDVTQQGYMVFTSVSDIKKTLPNFTPPQFAKVLEGHDKGCLTKASQTQKVTIAQTKTLRQLTKPEEIAATLGNPYCETVKGFKWVMESGRELTVKLDKTLDYEFSTNTSESLTNKKRTPKEANGDLDRPLPTRVSPSSLNPKGTGVKNQ